MKLRLFLVCLLCSSSIFGQTTLGQWNDYLSYKSVIDIVEGGDKIYAACENSLFSYDRSDNSISRYSSVNGMSDKGITTINWNQETQSLLVGYANGNIDILSDNGVDNFSDIRRSSITGNKSIRSFYMEDGFAYTGTGFGIVKINIEAREVAETYIIGQGGSEMLVSNVVKKDGKMYAATPIGLLEANLNTALQDFNNWDLVLGVPKGNIDLVFSVEDRLGVYYNFNDIERIYMQEGAFWDIKLDDGNINKVLSHNDHIVVMRFNWARFYNANFSTVKDITDYAFTDKERIFTGYIDSDGVYWIGDNSWGLLEEIGESNFNVYQPSGPEVNSAWQIDVIGDELWVAHGGINTIAEASFLETYFSGANNQDWTGYGRNEDLLDQGVLDIVDVAINPRNPEQVFFGSWVRGLVEKKPDGSLKVYKDIPAEPGDIVITESTQNEDYFRVAGLTYDNNGNLWMANSADSLQLKVLKSDGTNKSFDLNGISDPSKLSDIIHTSNGQIWGLSFNSSDARLYVYDYNGTIDNENDDRFLKINTGENNGGLPNNTVLSVAEDLDGEIWIGTLEGPAIIYTPEFLFENNPPQAQQIKIEQDGNVELVLKTSAITAIAVDGANRKWLGTKSSGVFLLSEDGTEEIYHFTEANSPLLDNNIRDIAINDKTGEVFFGTDQGLLSFVGDATLGERENTCANVFPNPVRPDYHGPIAIDGLARDSNVKITDIAGNIVYETTSNGGRAIWDGNNFSGERVQSGVYLALIISLIDQKETSCISKIMIIN